MIRNFFKGVRSYPNKKPYLEFFSALLTIPVLLSVVAVNYNNLTGNNNKDTSKQASTVVITQPAVEKNEPVEKEIIVTKEACKEGLGNVLILSPEENEKVKGNPVFIDISYDDSEHCQAVWSYRINSGQWSSFDDRSIALYDLPNGNIKFDLRVKSVVNTDQISISRNFIYENSATDGASIAPTIASQE